MSPMTRRLFILDDPDRFLAGTVGEPGARAFFLQARKGGALISVGLEKVQVAALAQRLEDLLDAVEAPDRAEAADDLTLEEPIVELFRVGAMAPTEDGEYAELPDEAEEGPDLLRIRIDAPAARAFVRRAEALVASGRPACPFCGEPLDPQGHFCPRGNGQLN